MRNSTYLTQSVGILLVAAATALPVGVAEAQERSREGREAVQRWPGPQDSRPAPGAPAPEARRSEPQRPDAGDRVYAQRQAQPRGSRPRGDNPRTGTAVPRGDGRPAPRAGGGRTVYVQPRGGNRYYFNGPRAYAYPYAYGSMGWGLGYYYNDPYAWYPGDPWRYGYAAPGYAYPGGAYGYDVGRLRLQVQPRNAEVYIDGYYAGIVDDFDGRFQGMSLESGGYAVEVALPGFEPLQFDIRITPGRTTTYRGELLPKRP